MVPMKLSAVDGQKVTDRVWAPPAGTLKLEGVKVKALWLKGGRSWIRLMLVTSSVALPVFSIWSGRVLQVPRCTFPKSSGLGTARIRGLVVGGGGGGGWVERGTSTWG